MKNTFYIKVYKPRKEDIYLLAGTLGFVTTVIYLIVDYLLSLFFKSTAVPYSIITSLNGLGNFLWSIGGFNCRHLFRSLYRFGIGANQL